MENFSDDDNFSEENELIDEFEEPPQKVQEQQIPKVSQAPQEKIDLEPVRKLTVKKKAPIVEESSEFEKPLRTRKILKKQKVAPTKQESKDEISKLLKKHIKKQPTSIEEWTKARKIPELHDIFKYTQDGDLEIGRVLEGDQIKIITLTEYKEASAQFIHTKLNEKKEQIKKAEEEYMISKRNLQNIMTEYLASDKSGADIAEVLRANQEVHDKECILNTLVKYPRDIKELDTRKLEESVLTLNPYDKKIIVDPVMYINYSYFSPELLFMPSEEENNLNLQESNENTNTNLNNESNTNNNSTMSGGNKKPLSMAAIMAIKARKAARGY